MSSISFTSDPGGKRARYEERWKNLTGYSDESRNAGLENPLAGTPYAELWENNPYADQYYNPSFWDKIGLSNKAKDANAEYDRLYNEYVSGLLDQSRQDEYNSPTAEAQRMRAAGINPDLVGLSGQSKTNAVEPPNAGPNPALSGVSPASNILQHMGSILSFALNAYQGVNSVLMSKDSADITNFKLLTDNAKPFVTQSFAEAFLNGLTPEISVASGSNSYASQYDTLRNQKKALKAFEHLFYSGDYSLQRKALSNINEMFDAQIGFRAREQFSNSHSIDNFVKIMVDESVKLYNLNRRSNISAKTKEEMLNRFRADSIDKMIKQYRSSNGQDILTGFMLAGMLESAGLPMVSDPKSYLMGAGDKISKDVGNFLDKIF